MSQSRQRLSETIIDMSLCGLDDPAALCFDRDATPWTDDAMWTPASRRQHSRAGLRDASDLTEDDRRIGEPMLPTAPG